ncbi:PAS domain S-box protein [Haloarchaeobius sp. HME9146]|uniref:PAS domain S-box protein n=1 Tax=Haloarchaeobius sp. HME9146 TaxID=2978732 RepID=UPI0021C1B51F|nr:PAS domain S-box protein [Haloarchaeobius sp. HME9146]MCT9098447.1 PAS domain S-box protein [Haloarchaeobius sp. HME9146]
MPAVRVLHVEDDTSFGEVTAELLGREDTDFEILTETNVTAAIDVLQNGEIHCVVSDYDMPEVDGLEFLKLVREYDSDLPFILFTGKGSEEIASAAISAGVTDYLQKGTGIEQYTILTNRIRNAVEGYRANRNLELWSRQHEAVAKLGRAALGRLDLAALFDQACDSLVDCLGTEYAKVLALTDDGTHLELVAGKGFDQHLLGTATVGVKDTSQAGYTLSVAGPVVVEDLATEDRFQRPALLVDHHIVSGISVGIGPVEGFWGVLGAHSTAPRTFSEKDITFVQNVANVLAATIENRQTVEELRESEQRFREIATVSPDTIFRATEAGTFVYLSNAVEALLGYEPESMLQLPFHRFVAAESQESARENFLRVRDGGVEKNVELTLLDVDGERVPVEVSASQVRDSDGNVFIQGVVRDVSDRKRREHELELKERAMTEAPFGITISDTSLPDNALVYTNQRFTELTGYDHDQLFGRNCRLLQGEDTDPAPVAEMRSAIAAGSPITVELLNYRADGTPFWNRVSIAPVTDADGAVTNFVGFQQDVTDQHEREAALRRLRAAVEQAGTGVYITDADGTIEYVNPAFEEITGYGASEAVGADPSILMSGEHDDAYFEGLWETVGRGEVWEDEVVNRRKSGEQYTAIQTVAPILDDGEVTGYVAIQNDVSERRLDQQRLEVLNRVLRHDIRTSVNIIQGSAELVAEVVDDPDGERHLQTILATCNRLLEESMKARRIQDLLKKNRHEVRTVRSVLDVLEATAVEREDGDVELVDESDGTAVLAIVQSALVELLENALEHGKGDSPPQVSVRVSDDDGWLEFRVADSGPGLPEAERRVIEQQTEQPLAHSSGIGLWIATWLVKASGGTILIERADSTGTILTVRVPRLDSADSTTA